MQVAATAMDSTALDHNLGISDLRILCSYGPQPASRSLSPLGLLIAPRSSRGGKGPEPSLLPRREQILHRYVFFLSFPS